MGEQTTLLLDDRQAFRDQIKRLELQHDWALEASKTDLHTAIVAVGLEDHARLKHKLREIRDEPVDDDVFETSTAENKSPIEAWLDGDYQQGENDE